MAFFFTVDPNLALKLPYVLLRPALRSATFCLRLQCLSQNPTFCYVPALRSATFRLGQ